MEGGNDHQRDLHRQEDGDDDYQHHGGVVGFPLSLVVPAAPGEQVCEYNYCFQGNCLIVFYCLLRHYLIKSWFVTPLLPPALLP